MRALLLLVFLISFRCQAADTTFIHTDTVPHSIKKAVILSAVLPGAGQVYNHLAMPKGQKKAFWKVPLIYAGLGVTSYFLISNQKQKNLYRSEYEYRQNNNGAYNDISLSVYDDDALVTLHDQYLSWRDLSILALSAAYLIQVVDAGVEAHFVSFDVSEDISMSFHPTLLNQSTGGISLRLNFH